MARKKKVGYQEFLRHLRKTRARRNWRLRDGCIRTRRDACPITRTYFELARHYYNEAEYTIAADKMGLDRRIVGTIAWATDGDGDYVMTWRQRQVRRDLLRAVGLKEKRA